MQSLRRVFATTALAVFCAVAPAAAAAPYVFDSANLLKPETVTALTSQISSLEAATGKEVVVDIVDSTGGMPPKDFAAQEFQAHKVNGVMIFISKTPKSVGVIPDRVSGSIFPAGTTSTIREAIRSSFRSGNYDEGVTNGVNLVISFYRSHAPALQRRQTAPRVVPAAFGMGEERQGGGINWFFIIVIGLGIWLLIRTLTRSSRGGGYYGGGGPPQNYGGPGPGYGGPGYGGGGFGGGGMGGGGGGGFFSSLLGGLGGAFLGNELFNSMNRPNPGEFNQANMSENSTTGGYEQPGYDQGAFQSDPGQADMGNSSFGDWGGDSGSSGGGDWGGGGGNNDSGW